MSKVMVNCNTGVEMVVPDELVALYQSWGHTIKPVEQPKKSAPRKRAAKKEA